MSKEALLERLAAFGIEGNEAQAYYHLSRLGPTKAGDLAKEADLSRTDVYRVMDDLEENGFVERTVDQPVRFIPVPIEDALARVVDTRRRRLDDLETERQELASAWPRPRARAEAGDARLSIHRDRAQIQGLLERLVDDARDEVLVICMKRTLARFESMDLLDALEDQAAEDVSIRILTEIDETNRATADRFASVATIRHVDLPAYYQIVLSDARRAALFVAVDPLTSTTEGAATVLHLTSQDFLLAQKALFDRLWTHGISLEERIHELETGEPAQRIEVVRGRWIRNEKMEEMLYRGEETVDLMLPADEAERLGTSGLARVLARRGDAGVDVRVLSEGAIEPELEDVTVRKGEIPGDQTELVVDGVERLVVKGGADEESGTADPGEWSVWTTVRRDVDRAVERFDRAWDGAA